MLWLVRCSWLRRGWRRVGFGAFGQVGIGFAREDRMRILERARQDALRDEISSSNCKLTARELRSQVISCRLSPPWGVFLRGTITTRPALFQLFPVLITCVKSTLRSGLGCRSRLLIGGERSNLSPFPRSGHLYPWICWLGFLTVFPGTWICWSELIS